VIAALPAATPPATASPYDEAVIGGKTVLKPDPAALRNLSERGVTAGILAPARLSDGVRFPIEGGALRDGPLGTVEHSGGLAFTTKPPAIAEARVGARVKFTDFTIEFGDGTAKLFARSGGSQVRFFDLELSGATPPGQFENPFKIKHIGATLAGPAARLMTEKLGVRFRAGDPAGSLNMKPLTGAEQKENG
jgi:hypothetical protein